MKSDSVFFPKVLILIQPFNRSAGGGITLTNLFRGWPSERLAVAALGSLINSETTFDVTDNYFVLGSDEERVKFPLNLIKRKVKSGVISGKGTDDSKRLPKRNPLRAWISSQIVMPILTGLGIYEFMYEIKLSDDLKEWINEFKPDVIYAQAHNRQRVLFCSDVQRFVQKPMAFHMMDDWFELIHYETLFSSYLKRKSTEDFVRMLSLCSLHLSISDGMGKAYRERYGFEFTTFHNPIDLDFWRAGQRADFRLGQSPEILYAGRVGLGIDSSLELMAKVIDGLNAERTMAIRFVLQVPQKSAWMEKYACVIHRQPVPYSQLPEKFGAADILYLPYDFSERSLSFIRYSMPTKASEYMISGTPILIMAPLDTALADYALECKWAKVVVEDKVDALRSALIELLDDVNTRKSISATAICVAEERHDAQKVREQLRDMLSTLVK